MLDVVVTCSNVPTMFPRIPRMLVAIALVLSIGLHWNLLQIVAWGGMLVKYSKGVSFKVAVEKTFNGKHPCCMCKAIEKAKRDEKKAPSKETDSKGPQLFVTSSLRLMFPPSEGELLLLRVAMLRQGSTAPPVPPPRLA